MDKEEEEESAYIISSLSLQCLSLSAVRGGGREG